MKALITGGAGYVGSTVASALLDAGDEPVIVDNLTKGDAAFLHDRIGYVGDVGDRRLLARIFAEHPDIDVAIHCAARTIVSESLVDPLGYYRENVAKSVELVDGLLAHGCTRLVFTSSAAVYGAIGTRVATE
jgi:UDP-glucose 4-epimerase